MRRGITIADQPQMHMVPAVFRYHRPKGSMAAYYRLLVVILGASAAGCANASPKAEVTERDVVDSHPAPQWRELRAQVDSGLKSMERQRGAALRESQRKQMERVNALIDAFQAEMISMEMTCDAHVLALTDSVRRDAGVQTTMTPEQLRVELPARTERLRRLIGAQRLMMHSVM
jgi:hypothetical protein